MEKPPETGYVVGSAVSASVARMQAKAAQLAEQLQFAQAQASNPFNAVAVGMLQQSHTVCPESQTEIGSPKPNSTTPPVPSVFWRLAAVDSAASKPAAQNTSDTQYQALALQCQKLETEVQLWKHKHAEALKEIERRQDSYMRREEQLRSQLNETAELGDTATTAARSSSPAKGDYESHEATMVDTGSMRDHSMCDGNWQDSQAHKAQKVLTLPEMQQQVLQGLDDLLQRQRLQMRTEESQQLHQFRGRLVEIEAQLASYRQAAAAHQDDWLGKTVALRKELTVTQEIAAKLDAMYKLAEEEAAQLRVQFKAQEDDRQHIIRQMLALKRENARLKQEHTALHEELDQVMIVALEVDAVSQSGGLASAALGNSQLLNRPATAGARTLSVSDVGYKDASASSSYSRPQSAAGRLSTASRQARHLQPQQPRVRPWSAAPGCQESTQQRLACKSTGQNGHLDTEIVESRLARYAYVIQKLQKLLESERRQLRQLRNRYNAELSKRSELQTLLLNGIELAKQRTNEAVRFAQQRQLLPSALAAAVSPSMGLEPACAAELQEVMSRPASAAAISNEQQYEGSGPGSANVIASCAWVSQPLNSGTMCEQGLDQATGQVLLENLLANRHILELLYKHAFPDCAAEAEQPIAISTGPVSGTTNPQQPTQSKVEGLTISQQQQQHHPVDALQAAEHVVQVILDDLVNSASSESGVVSDSSEASSEDHVSVQLDAPGPTNACSNAPHSGLAHEVCQQSPVLQEVPQQHGSQDEQQMMPHQLGFTCTSQRMHQHSTRTGQRQPTVSRSAASLMLPSFPHRQQLHCTRICRQYVDTQPSTAVQPALGTTGNRRPASAVTKAVKVHGQLDTRPWSAMYIARGCSAGTLEAQVAPARGAAHTRPATAASAVRASPGHNCPAQRSSRPWSVGADRVMERFLSKTDGRQHEPF